MDQGPSRGRLTRQRIRSVLSGAAATATPAAAAGIPVAVSAATELGVECAGA